MIIRRTQNTTPLDRPFPDENTVSEMYCNEAYTVDNEAVEDWTSSLQMLLTFAAIFSAVLITLIVDSKTLLEQDKTEVLVDAVVFLMNNLANGTHRPYNPPKFQPSTQSILVNCFFFASLCLSIATALAAVLAMQWVTDYGAVTRRAGSTPEERVKRRHFRYQGGQDWRMDGIIGALPIALHLSVLLFFVGLIVWMWDVHHSVFAVVFICGAVAALFYLLTTILAIFYPSCPYRTPLASWTYILLHLLVRVLFPSSWLTTPTRELKNDGKRREASDAGHLSRLRLFVTPLLSCLAPPSLGLRDDSYIRHPDKSLMANSLVWLSKQLPISLDIYRRLLVFIDGFSSVVDSEVHGPVVPWEEIFRVLGAIYQSFIEVPGVPGVKEEEFVEFARRTHCLSQPGMSEILDSVSRGGSEEATMGDSISPIRLLRAWTKSTSSHTSDALRRQRFSDEVVLHDLISDVSSSSQNLVETWHGLLDDEAKATARILPMILGSMIRHGAEEKRVQRRDACLYLISTRRLPWESTVPFYTGTWHEMNTPSNALFRKLRAVDWVKSLEGHPQKAIILEYLSDIAAHTLMKLLLIENKLTEEKENELKRVGLYELSGWTRAEEMLYSALLAFDQLVRNAESQEAKQRLIERSLRIIWGDLMGSSVSLDPKYLPDWRKGKMQSLSDPLLRLVACATLGIEWKEEWTPDLLNVKDSLSEGLWQRVSNICFRRSPFFDGDQTFLWQLRLRLWIHFHPDITSYYLYNIIKDVALLKRLVQETQSSRLGIDNAADFCLALFHLNHAYRWDGNTPDFPTLIPGILIQDTTSALDSLFPTECIEYLSSIGDEINADPARLIRLLIELIRADINHDPNYRRPQNLLNLLQHAESQLSGKELHTFSPSCRRLIRYIKASYQQFEDTWDSVVDQNEIYDDDDDDDDDPRPHYQKVNRRELKEVCERVVVLLEPSETWEGEAKDVSWPRNLLRPTGTEVDPFEEDVEHTNSRESSEDDDSGDDDEEDYGHHQDQNHNHDDHLDNSAFREVEAPLE